LSPPGRTQPEVRGWIARAFTAAEDVVYIGLGLLLAGSALVLLVTGFINFGQSVAEGTLPASIIELLDRILLILHGLGSDARRRYTFH
jgi:hypothetical protein